MILILVRRRTAVAKCNIEPAKTAGRYAYGDSSSHPADHRPSNKTILSQTTRTAYRYSSTCRAPLRLYKGNEPHAIAALLPRQKKSKLRNCGKRVSRIWERHMPNECVTRDPTEGNKNQTTIVDELAFVKEDSNDVCMLLPCK